MGSLLKKLSSVFGVALLLLFWGLLSWAQGKAQKTPPKPNEKSGVVAQKYPIFFDSDWSYLEKDLDLFWGSDPFLKTPGFVLQPSAKKPLVLSSILYSRDHAMAWIDGQKVTVNNLVRGQRVVDIGPNYVLLKNELGLTELTLATPLATHRAEIEPAGPTKLPTTLPPKVFPKKESEGAKVLRSLSSESSEEVGKAPAALPSKTPNLDVSPTTGERPKKE